MKTLISRDFVKFLLLLCFAAPLHAADMTSFRSTPGGKVRLEGTSTIHDWQVEGYLIGGTVEAGPKFPTEPGQSVEPGKVEAKANVFIPIRSLTSIEKDGSPYSTSMDDIMYQKLSQATQPRIQFQLDDLVLKEAAKKADEPYVFEATGQLAVGGVTNKITMPVDVLPMSGGKLKVSGTTTVKMTDFKIDPPAPKIALGMIKTGDDVKIIFTWMLKKSAAK